MPTGCCRKQDSNAADGGRSWAHAAYRAVSWIVPAVVLAAMPKCPLCLAAYVALFTGLGISLAAAKFAWWSVAICGVTLLMFLAAPAMRRLLRAIECVRHSLTYDVTDR